MNKWEAEVQQSLLNSEAEAIKALERQYKQALKNINEKIRLFTANIMELDDAISVSTDPDEQERLLSMKQSKIYQKQYQEALKGQVSGILDKMQSDQYSTIDKYLHDCYETSYVGTFYDLAKQGIPIIQPINQAAVTKAILTDSKIVEGYYKRLGVSTSKLKKVITQEISRGIASGLTYGDIARNINNASKSGAYNAYRIARTEGHRIQQSATYDAQVVIKNKGIDVLRQWDAVLDGRTRDSHRMLDGQIREVDEPFEINGRKVMKPGEFGRPEEDINCRCIITTRIPEDLDEEELEELKKRAEFFGIDKTKKFEEYKQKYLNAAETVNNDVTIKTLGSAKAKDFDELSSYMKDNYGIKLTKKAQALDFEAVKDATTGIEWTIQQFHEANGYLKKIDSNKKGGVMNCTGDVISCSPIAFDGHYYSGNHEFFISTGVHEATHMIEGYLIGNTTSVEKEFVEMWNTHSIAKSIVKEAISNIPSSMTEGKELWEIYETISPYASANASECMAEAISDIYKNGDNASDLSKEIFRILKGRM